ncbi:MAG: hypothetical protein JXA54_07425 [Candidatus Heimdallarchaeota archaeon]|nr:hypothetical protein [Candidatus Heimdallarchaeota archaeon]
MIVNNIFVVLISKCGQQIGVGFDYVQPVGRKEKEILAHLDGFLELFV